ncbi:oxidoreductase 2-nitropropane dioxygenase [Massariosphaeria phaeospora]|uniref:Oxidoreductase 2-nitropropane dioxygenase n=1 Tax=Massariosphaeria phaeospora TaxID=100035 RepID=A0A7C8MLT6_9PLEO|nr:oxidoreductase 2-nitropropane dioxygenase [Massariosphaeria phaeospora]
MTDIARLKTDYPWIETPLIVGAPMRLIALADLATEISRAGGIGFIGAGTDVSNLASHLQAAQQLLQNQNTTLPTREGMLPIGVGFINWGVALSETIPIIERYRPAAAWFFAPSSIASLMEWTEKSRNASPETKIWVQIGSVREAVDALNARPDVLVVQGTDAGGHGLVQGASIVSLVPEVDDAVRGIARAAGFEAPVILAAGGIVEGRSAAAALALGASGVVLGTRFLAAKEANIAKGYQDEVVRVNDGGQTTVRTKVYDDLRGTTGWAQTHNARGIINRSFKDALKGLDEAENKRLYEQDMRKGDAGWGAEARMTTYAGAGVGLVRAIAGAGPIVRDVRSQAVKVLEKFTRAAASGKL